MGFEARWLPNQWWARAHPDELEIVAEEADGQDQIEHYRRNCVEDANHITQSYASKVWAQDVKDLLRGYIRHLREIGLYDRVIAYQICAGVCGEWVKGDSDQMNRFGDYSRPMQLHFRNWLRRNYGDDIQRLRAAWSDDGLTFDMADVPLPQAQAHTARFVP
jgi:beta-galactosidase GanA